MIPLLDVHMPANLQKNKKYNKTTKHDIEE